MGEKQSTFKANIAREQAATYLEDLAASVRAGTVALSQGDRQVVLNPASSMALELAVSDKKGRQRLELELTWYAAPETGGTDALTISAQAPQPQPADDGSADAAPEADQDDDGDDDGNEDGEPAPSDPRDPDANG